MTQKILCVPSRFFLCVPVLPVSFQGVVALIVMTRSALIRYHNSSLLNHRVPLFTPDLTRNRLYFTHQNHHAPPPCPLSADVAPSAGAGRGRASDSARLPPGASADGPADGQDAHHGGALLVRGPRAHGGLVPQLQGAVRHTPGECVNAGGVRPTVAVTLRAVMWCVEHCRPVGGVFFYIWGFSAPRTSTGGYLDGQLLEKSKTDWAMGERTIWFCDAGL